jgi:uncharacterized protein
VSRRAHTRRTRLFLPVLVLAALVPLVFSLGSARATPTELFLSEYIEGSSNNKALEIFNGTSAPVDLTAAGYNVQMFSNGSSSAGLTIALNGTVAAGDIFVLAHGSANAEIRTQADQTNGAGWFNGNDAVVLRRGATVLDVIGQIGFDPGSEWGSGLTSTQDNTLRRKATVQAGDPNGSDAFDPAVQWDGFATNDASGLGSHTIVEGDVAPAVSAADPAADAAEVPVDANVDVTFSEPVNVTGAWFSISSRRAGRTRRPSAAARSRSHSTRTPTSPPTSPAPCRSQPPR